MFTFSFLFARRVSSAFFLASCSFFKCSGDIGFRGFPFLFEIKLLLDYFCTQTTFFLQDFIKYEDIRANIYVIGVNLDWNHQESRSRGQPKPFCSRCCSGGLCFSLIWMAMFLPLFLFTSGTAPQNDQNSIQKVSLQVSIDTFPNFFQMDSNIEEANQERMTPLFSGTLLCHVF